MRTRREFLTALAAAAAAWAGRDLAADGGPAGSPDLVNAATIPQTGPAWYRRTVRWMQTNIAEIDPTRYDIPWWREQWRRTHTQGVVVNAGGLVAYYPTRLPFHRTAKFLGSRDLFGELSRAAHDDGIVVFARMDSNGAGDDVLQAHPDWIARNAAGEPYRDRDLNVPCINGAFYREHIPAILREIAQAYRPEGFTDNSWSGLPRASICHCVNCRQKFAADRGAALPMRRDWNDPVYRAWIEWGYACRLEIWDLFNATARAAGGPACLWVGMIGGSIASAAADFRDYAQICKRTELVMLDNQRRTDATGFQANGQTGKLVHGLMGWDKLAPESMALYQTSAATFRLSMRPEPELRLWAVEGFASGIQPWWHYVNAYHEDRRMYDAPKAMADWYLENETLLTRRQPIATVGIVYSQRNHDFFGRDDADLHVTLPQRGFMQALTRARIPYVLVNADDLPQQASGLRLLVLPNVGAMTPAQNRAVRDFVAGGRSLIASGLTSLFTESGDARPDFGLADTLRVRLPEHHPLRDETTRRQWAAGSAQTYLRLDPELRAGVPGPHIASEPPVTGTRHPILKGFDATDLLPFGGTLEDLHLDAGVDVLLTFVPPLPAFPPESVWSPNTRSSFPGLVVHEEAGGGRVAYLAADLDRRYARDNLSDIGTLLANLVRWAAKDDIPLAVSGPGLLDCHLYRQDARLILHIVNLTNEGTWRGPVDELIPVGPIEVRIQLPDGQRPRGARLLAAKRTVPFTTASGWVTIRMASILDHEVVVIDRT